MTSFIGFIMGLKIFFWFFVLIGIVWFAPEIGAGLSGIADRFDHLIGYEASQ